MLYLIGVLALLVVVALICLAYAIKNPVESLRDTAKSMEPEGITAKQNARLKRRA